MSPGQQLIDDDCDGDPCLSAEIKSRDERDEWKIRHFICRKCCDAFLHGADGHAIHAAPAWARDWGKGGSSEIVIRLTW